MTDMTSRTSPSSSAAGGAVTPSNNGRGVDRDKSGAIKPPPHIQRRTSRGDREDVVAMMKRDMSYSAVASAHHRGDMSSDEDSGSFVSGSSSNDNNPDASHVSRNSNLSEYGGKDGHTSKQQSEEEAQEEGIAWRRKLVLLLWGVVACLVIVAIAAVSVGIRKDNEDQQQLTTTTTSDVKPEDVAASLEDTQKEQQNNLQSSLRSLTESLTASNPETQWPFVTSPLMAVQGRSIRALNPGVEFIAVAPFVTTTQQYWWQNYTWSQQGWIQRDWEYLGNLDETMVPPLRTIAPEIYPDSFVENNRDRSYECMAPLWQTSPPPTEPYKLNHDMLTVPAVSELYQQLLQLLQEEEEEEEKEEGTSTTSSASASFQGAVVSPLLKELPYLYGFEDNNENDNDPRSILLLPIYDSLKMDTDQAKKKEIVALMQVVINWEQLLQDLLPKDSYRQGMLQNDCGDQLQFYSESYLEQTGWSSNENDVEENEDEDEPILLQQELLSSEIGGCSFSVVMELQSSGNADNDEDQQSSHDIAGILVLALVPLAFTLATLCLVLITLTQWMQMIDDRHEKLQKTSAKSSAIVASMFPSNIRDRLYAEGDEEVPIKKDSTSSSKRDSGGSGRKGILRVSTGSKDAPGINLDTRSGISAISIDSMAASETENHNNLTIQEEGENLECYPEGHPRITASGSERLKTYLDTGLGADDSTYSAPIADLFPNCTVLLADIAGFTAWSSVREPSQVFTLLETLYKKFDEIAKKRHVFKVETVGDCYVAVTGLPEPQEDHALIMVRFARDCMYKSYELTKKLEVTLGPDTAELSMRFGLHSGPVTAGVLRGDRARFQLFGDTVNTASRMESTGQKGRIQMSQETADILILARKSHLIRQREDTVTAKGKGEMTTYWLALGADPDDIGEEDMPKPTLLSRNTSGVDSIIEGNEDESESSDDEDDDEVDDLNDSSAGDNKTVTTAKTMLSIRTVPTRRRPPAVSMSGLHSLKALREKKQSKESRLVDWNVEVLGKLLKQVVARRNALGREASDGEVKLERPEGQTVLEEVREIITLPKFDASAAKNQEDPEKTELDPDVKEQLHDYVSTLASMYRDNPFHNYEHASHVTMSVVKLLSRIVAPKRTEGMTSAERIASELHDHTYGITSDPLTQFAVVMSALIHDVDHTGVPNSQLVKENARVAAYYKNKSVAEQNSVDMSWSLLMEPQFRDLRNAIYCDEAELTRFRSLIVNAVMATDIVDKELKQLRNNRWDKAFSGDVPKTEQEVHAAVNRKATIVLEHLIQASDVSHTMQHWHVYRKWNERLFHEMYNAYRAGRAEKDPSEFWYKGEIGFFDFYIIPLAKKLKDCGVFGVSSDEYLNYAMKNREEWARKGEAVTAEMVAKARDKDLARLERQASVRGPLIAEMKAAVASMRSPKKSADMFRQPSFRHLRAEPHAMESIAMPHHGFRRQPPRRGTPNRNVKSAVSIGTAERDALRQFRQTHPMNQQNRSDKSVATAATAPGALGAATTSSSMPPGGGMMMNGTKISTPPMNTLYPASGGGGAMINGKRNSGPPGGMGMRKPERRCSNV